MRTRLPAWPIFVTALVLPAVAHAQFETDSPYSRHTSDRFWPLFIGLTIFFTVVILGVSVIAGWVIHKNSGTQVRGAAPAPAAARVKPSPLAALAGLFGLAVAAGCIAFALDTRDLRLVFGPAAGMYSYVILFVGLMALPGGFMGIWVGVRALFKPEAT